jgi:hypothetical protein
MLDAINITKIDLFILDVEASTKKVKMVVILSYNSHFYGCVVSWSSIFLVLIRLLIGTIIVHNLPIVSVVLICMKLSKPQAC